MTLFAAPPNDDHSSCRRTDKGKGPLWSSYTASCGKDGSSSGTYDVGVRMFCSVISGRRQGKLQR
jgi:hypothetical protein